MPVFKLMKCSIRSLVCENKTKSLSEIYQWDFDIMKIAIPKIVLLNNMSLNSEYTYENYYKRHLEAAPQCEPEAGGAPDGAPLAGAPRKAGSLSVLDIRTKPEVLEKWVSSPAKGQCSPKEWLNMNNLSKNYDV